MCGRFQMTLVETPVGKQIKERIERLHLVFKEGEVLPTDDVLVIIPKEDRIDLAIKKWGITGKSLIINARVETLNDKITFKDITNNRCAIICNGFYQWDKNKDKYYFSSKNDYMYLACIFNKDNQLVILTKDADDKFKTIHNRQPIIMDKEEMLRYVHNDDIPITIKELKVTRSYKETSLFD